MMNEFEQLSQLIQEFESTDFTDEQYKHKTQSLAKKKVDWYLVENYYKSISLDDVCLMLIKKFWTMCVMWRLWVEMLRYYTNSIPIALQVI